MQSTRTTMNMVGTIPVIQPTILRPTVVTFVQQLSETQWTTIKHGSLDQETQDMITDMCVDIVGTVAKYISIALEMRESKECPPKSPKGSITEKDVHAILGDSIKSTIADALGIKEDIHSRTTEEVNDLVVQEVTERINSNGVSRGPGQQATKSFCYRLRKMVIRIGKIMLMCCSYYCDYPDSRNVWSLTPTKTEVQDEDVKEEEPVGDHFQTPVTPFMEDEPEMFHSESPKHETFQAVKSILSEHRDDLDDSDSEDDLSEEELSQHLSSSDRDTNQTASEIVKIVCGDSVSQEPEASSVREATAPTNVQKTRETKTIRRIKMFFTKRFAKESIMKLFLKLTEKTSVEERDYVVGPLMAGVSTIVDDMIKTTERQCTDVMCFYRRMARNITDGQFENDKTMLIEAVVEENQAFPKLTEISQSAATPAPVTEETNIREEAGLSGLASLDYWDRLTCKVLASKLVKTITGTWSIDVQGDQAISVLTEALWAEMEGSKVKVDLSLVNVRKMVKKVHKKLSKKLQIELIKFTIVQDPKVLTHIIEAFKEELIPKQKSGVKGFFKSVFKPFTRIFKRD
ncbi:uncharacterized protein LOC117810083 isoform X1 [Xyrichtys novacula]|uniref:Uncharacterized protein LOC117810083 isoform X1 n=1 Tax=Xyrichtys novacula TaxID=13765 RepID=A0AAV1FE77_XYRNO|nr:uncharacterized protein LOC117810083 isoform X1 [Xyrichtys novacula]CAJ1059487.1 uncharacterized protein LOC117810083 isoform X1 [Xyrichtys novacula]